MDALRRSVRSERSGEAPVQQQRGKQRPARAKAAERKRGATKTKRLKRAG